MENGGGGGGGDQNQNQSINGRGGGGGGHNGNNSNYSWDFWELGSNNSSSSSSSSRFDWSHHHHHNHQSTAAAAAGGHAWMISNQVNNAHPSSSSSSHQHQQHFAHYLHQQQQQQQSQSSLYAGGGSVHPDPHLTCLKLGKRHYFEDHGPPPPQLHLLQQQPPPPPPPQLLMGDRHVAANGFQMIKRGRSFDDPGVLIGAGTGHHSVSPSSTTSASISSVGSTVVIPRCQVEGCHVALIHAKDYHRRHKVCEMHSKAPKVVVLGIEQRFCQQCSRFHVVSEFDDSKRSCRRRLAGHNERRRKSTSSSNDSNTSRNPNQETRSMDGRFSCVSPSTGRALSLLSSAKLSTSWVSPADLSTRSSAALRELIAEKRAAVLGKQLLFEQNWHQNGMENTGGADHHQTHGGVLSQVPGLQHHQVFPADPSEWDRFQESDAAHVTLDLMQTPSSPFGFLSGGRSNKSNNKDEEEDQCCEIWKSLEGTHVV